MNIKYVGVLAVLLACVMWAIEPILAKLSFQNSDFLHTLAIRAIFVTLAAFVYGALTSKAEFRINKQQFSALVFIAFVANLFGDIVYFFALTQVSVVDAVLFGSMQPVFVILIGLMVLKEDKLTKLDYIGILIMIISGLLITTKTLGNFSTLRLGIYGDLFALSATVAWATATVAFRKYLKGMNAGVVCFYRFLFVSIVFTVYLISNSAFIITSSIQILLGGLVGIGVISYVEGLKRIKAAQASALALSTPFFAAILGFFVLGELVTSMQIIGILVLFVGILLLLRRKEH